MTEKQLVDLWLDYLRRQAKAAKIELLVWKIETAATQGVPDLWICVDGVPMWVECKKTAAYKELVYQPNQRKNLFFLKQQGHKCATLAITEELTAYWVPPPQHAEDVGSKVTVISNYKEWAPTEALLGLLSMAYGNANMAKERLGAWRLRNE